MNPVFMDSKFPYQTTGVVIAVTMLRFGHYVSGQHSYATWYEVRRRYP